MKKKESSSKPLKHKTNSSIVKKTTSKSKLKAKQPPKQEEYFILLGDQFYVASSKTERSNYQQFQQKVKAKPQVVKKPQQRSGREASDSINLKQYVKSLSKAQKQQLFRDLQKQIQIDRDQVPQLPQNQSEDKLRKLNLKLESIRGELMKGWQQQINKINHIFQNEQISLQDKNQKITLVQKIRNNKLAMIDHISVLFEKIMLEDTELELNKQEHIEHIINSLNSFNAFPSMAQHSADIEAALSPFEIDLPYISKSDKQEKEKSDDDNIQRQLFLQDKAERNEEKDSPQVKIQNIQNFQEPSVFNHEHLRLDIRLDEVQFGKDHYQDDIVQDSSEKIAEDVSSKQFKSQDINSANESIERSSRDQQVSSFLSQKKKLQQQFLCVDEHTDNKIKIPMLMTKDRLEQLQFQKITKQKQALSIGIKSRMSYQLSEIAPQNNQHFTTLIDVNTFVVSFYQFVMQRSLMEVIEGLNLAYGKSSLDKLFQIRNEGFVPDYDNHNILPEELLMQYHQQITLSVRKLSDFQKIHNKAIFQAFNTGLNVYRPYYQLEGDVFPWNTSEKGLTFYQISEDNIQEVFQKSKMKVLQSCTNLCGIIPNCQLSTTQSKKDLDKRNQDCYERVLKNELNQKFADWYNKVLNFQALARLNLFDKLFEEEIMLVCHELANLNL